MFLLNRVFVSRASVICRMGAVMGVLSTVIFPLLHQNYGLQFSALIGIVCQLVCVTAGVVPFLLSNSSQLKLVLLMLFLALSRFGLWTFDLSVNQLLQDKTPKEQLGRVFSVQQMLQSMFQTMAYLASLAWSNPVNFVWLMFSSIVVVLLAAVLFILYYIQYINRVS